MKSFFCLLVITLFFSCRKKKYEPYIGTYLCLVTEYLDSTHNTFNWDTTYTTNADLIDLDVKNMQFRDLPVPYKYIQDNGEYKTGYFVSGIFWGREIISASIHELFASPNCPLKEPKTNRITTE